MEGVGAPGSRKSTLTFVLTPMKTNLTLVRKYRPKSVHYNIEPQLLIKIDKID